MSQLERMKVRIIPFIITWDGLVTKYNKTYREELKLSNRIFAYIQSVVLKKTMETVSLEKRTNGNQHKILEEEREEEAMSRIFNLCQNLEEAQGQEKTSPEHTIM